MSGSRIRLSVVSKVPSPLARAASMKDHAAGMIDPYKVAVANRLPGSSRGEMHGMTNTGT